MNYHNAIASLETAFSQDRKRKPTRDCYRSYAERYIHFIANNPALSGKSSEEKVSAFLETFSNHASATQRQALNAIVYLYKKALKKPLGKLPAWTKSRIPKKLPTWLPPSECLTLFKHMEGTPRLMAELMFGSGLRLNECVSLRIQDIDIHAKSVKVRSGKGDKWRVTCLPAFLIPAIQEQIELCQSLFDSDRRDNINPVELPEGLERKFPNGGNQFEWFWLFPAKSRCRKTLYRDRWHIHENTVGKALATARKRARIGKRVTAHTLRHSFATASLSAGMPIHELKDLMGHSSIKTTEIYLHCLPLLASRSQSPLDVAINGPAEKIIPFQPETSTESMKAS